MFEVRDYLVRNAGSRTQLHLRASDPFPQRAQPLMERSETPASSVASLRVRPVMDAAYCTISHDGHLWTSSLTDGWSTGWRCSDVA